MVNTHGIYVVQYSPPSLSYTLDIIHPSRGPGPTLSHALFSSEFSLCLLWPVFHGGSGRGDSIGVSFLSVNCSFEFLSSSLITKAPIR